MITKQFTVIDRNESNRTGEFRGTVTLTPVVDQPASLAPMPFRAGDYPLTDLSATEYAKYPLGATVTVTFTSSAE